MNQQIHYNIHLAIIRCAEKKSSLYVQVKFAIGEMNVVDSCRVQENFSSHPLACGTDLLCCVINRAISTRFVQRASIAFFESVLRRRVSLRARMDTWI